VPALASVAGVIRGDALAYRRDRARLDGPFEPDPRRSALAERGAMDSTLARLGAADVTLLTPEGWVVAKHFWRTPPPASVGC